MRTPCLEGSPPAALGSLRVDLARDADSIRRALGVKSATAAVRRSRWRAAQASKPYRRPQISFGPMRMEEPAQVSPTAGLMIRLFFWGAISAVLLGLAVRFFG